MKTFVWCPEEGLQWCLDVYKEPHAHICIRSVGETVKKPVCGSSALYLEFHDLGDNCPNDLKDGLFKKVHAEQIVDAVIGWKEGLVVINCEAGISRSPGVVLALRRHFGGDTEEVFRKAVPNIYVTSILTRALNKLRHSRKR